MSSQLPINLPVPLMQTRWASQLNPVLANPLNSVNVLKNISLAVGNNVINHLLGQQMQGWQILDINAASAIYRSAPFNDLTLTLNASAPCIVNIGVF